MTLTKKVIAQALVDRNGYTRVQASNESGHGK